MRSLNLDQLRTLVAIADLGSFAAAAQALHLAPPTVSLHVSELEARLGMPLFVRGRRTVSLSTAGQSLLPRARRLLQEAEDLEQSMTLQARGQTGRVRLAASTGPLVHLLPPVLERMQQQHPALEVELAILGTRDARERLLAGRIDLALVTLPLEPARELATVPWRVDPLVALLPPQWPAPARVTPAWLAARPLIFNEPGAQMHRQTLAWFAAAGLHPQPRIELNYTEAMKSLVASGYGAAVMPLDGEDEAPQLALHGRIQRRPLSPPLQRELALAWRAGEETQPGIGPLLSILREAAQRPAASARRQRPAGGPATARSSRRR